jgi:hypothetical protein
MYQLGFLVSALGCNLSNLLGFMPRTIEVKYFDHALQLFMTQKITVVYSLSA